MDKKSAQSGIVHISLVLVLAVIGVAGYYLFNGAEVRSSSRSFSNLSATLKQDRATFNFSYSSFSPNYKIDISTSSNIKQNLYRNFGQGSSSPIVVNTPQSKYPSYQCGSTLYWIVKATDERSVREVKSSVQTAVVDCSVPTPTPTSTPEPTPTLQCKLSSATWSTNSVQEGTIVSLTVNGSSECTGRQAGFEVWEDDFLTGEGSGDDLAIVQPSSAIFNGTQFQTSWVAEYQNDCGGLCNPPEYYFKATLTDGSGANIRSSDPELQVTQIPAPTPTPSPTLSPSPSPSLTPTPTSTPIATCTPAVPPTSSKRVFITSFAYYGNLGGLAGADQKCQERANAACLGGVWKAWLSDSTTSASSRLVHFSGPYKRMDGATIANNWTDLTDGSLQNPINITEFGNPETITYAGQTCNGVWTYTKTDGTASVDSGVNCLDWTNPYANTTGSAGVSNLSCYYDPTLTWTSGNPSLCSNRYNLYCFEQ